ncbi:hypothetical protein COY87_04795 [Candidatus Roizmanbacteria bacterium CG_4_10_14_0_8_um_filter_33_9]|uniref:Glycosyltransferase RgtA/B/C/D-like domain-containing protein n=1 Tax=Candidatus Roizmanbacteria bacterium CG_4_10_14_0_8_um_filter_33_9 TaxID=1974826 RepID=A0A2M7QH92_9BACT|nr:MAG: hypothetical protein COY87_04795 [Candidatus Roizmanbacteria bacterium CG_4_10_14_0_8_um_filter_33_9]
MKQKWIKLLLLGAFLLLFGYFAFQAVNSIPSEYDSITYHIPLAKSILNGRIFYPDKLHFPNSTFPAASELILALLLFFHIPLNLFNIIAWIVLIYLLFRLGNAYKLKQSTYIFVLSIITLPTIVRLLLTQTVDVWFAVFFVWVLLLFQKPEKKIGYFFQLGLSMGLLIGSKYSGPLFLSALIFVYGKKVASYLSFVRFVYLFIPFSIFGLSWYIRNILVYANPLYPAPFMWMNGTSAFSPEVFLSHFKMITSVENGLLYSVNAILSEYLFWPFIIILGILFVKKSNKDQTIINEKGRLLTLGLIGIIIYLVIPGYAYNYNNYVSEIRYSIPIIISYILLFFYYIRKTALLRFIPLFVFLNFIALFTLFFYGEYHPKIIVIIGITIFLCIKIYFAIKQKN